MQPGVRAMRVPLHHPDAEDVFVRGLISDSTLTCKVYQVDRVQNPGLYWLYCARKHQVELANGVNPPNETLLWHGNSFQTTEKIVNFGFDRGYSQPGGRHGYGVYFAYAPGLASRQIYAKPHPRSKKQEVMLCKVLTGRIGQGVLHLVETPLLPNGGGYFDSVADDPINPSICTVFNDAQAYPAYIVTIKRYTKKL